MSRIAANDIEFEYAEYGQAGGEPIIIINGLAGQLVDWPEMLLHELAARGLHVIVFDNRDAGLSTELAHLGEPDLAGVVNDALEPPYTLVDMGDDVVALLDALDIEKAHVLGASMGGSIAQAVALDHPDRVCTLTVAMTTPFRPFRDEPFLSTVTQASPVERDRDTVIAGDVAGFRWLGGPGGFVSEADARVRAERRYDRSYRPRAALRHIAAILGSPDRRAELGRLDVPALVLHGEDDPLIDVRNGRALAAAITGARLVVAPLRGHQEDWLVEYVDDIFENTQRAKA
ncbi:MAG: alpha/beta hydrolase [Microbacterium sp.]|uniref:alpha/beta fold hydrolase n=1 Tax=Microbacterium sp. TaxID=51671 RepID=UPI001AC8F1CC|nr:alpha/beta hydrolase [Microbacterium sp.]MBN9155277.1 alpha/beta hydrolase [Microbacterium sp.]